MKNLLLITTLLIIPFALGACNTVEGMGRDMEKAGKTVQGW